MNGQRTMMMAVRLYEAGLLTINQYKNRIQLGYEGMPPDYITSAHTYLYRSAMAL